PRLPLDEALHALEGVVAAAVVHEDDLERVAVLERHQGAHQPRQELLDRRRFVVDWGDDADELHPPSFRDAVRTSTSRRSRRTLRPRSGRAAHRPATAAAPSTPSRWRLARRSNT